MRITGQAEFFETWQSTKDWLLDNYSSGDAELDADLRMDRLTMRYNEGVQSFINRFETVLSDLSWNDPAICSAFRKKITVEILAKVQASHFNGLPQTFAAFKRAAQQAESQLKLGKRTLEDREEANHRNSQKKVRFASTEDKSGRGATSPFRERSNNIGASTTTTPPNSNPLGLKEEKLRRKELGLCTICASDKHWADKCPERLERAKNARP